MTVTFPVMPEIVPAAKAGIATIDHFEISEAEVRFANLRQALNAHRYDPIDRISPGRYARLLVNGELMMTDTPMERYSNEEAVRRATGRVLIAGLGLGMILHPILAKPEVEQVTVLEIAGDVISLVAPSLTTFSDRLTLVESDAFTWAPPKGSKFDVIYFDIWPTISADNLPEMAKLHRRYRRYLAPGGWMESWRRNACRRAARRSRW